MIRTESELEDALDSARYKVDVKRTMISKEIEATGSIEDPSAWRTLGRYEFTAGAYELALADVEASCESFAESALIYSGHLQSVLADHRAGTRAGGYWNSYLQDVERTLNIAILGSEEDVESHAITLARKHTEEDAETPFFEYWYHRVHALAALVDGDIELARDHLTQAQARQTVLDREDSDPVLPLYRGMVTEDAGTIESAVDALATEHEQSYEAPPANGLELLTLSGVAGLALARRQGLDVCVDHDAIPPATCEYDWTHRPHELSDLAHRIVETFDHYDGSL